MYAAAGGASLASRQARRKQKLHHTTENMHQQFHKRFQQLQHQHAPACAEGYHYMRTSSSGLLSPSHLPSCADLHSRGNTIDFGLQEQFLEGKSSSVWLEREKREDGFSPLTEVPPTPLIGHGKLKTSENQRKWAKRNKIVESSFGDSTEELRGGLHRQYDAAANMLLYVGLCAVALGLVIAFVGTGEKGFKTVQLRLIGPTMIGCGTFCCFLRILFCFCPTRCMRKRFKHRYKTAGGDSNLSEAAQLNKHCTFGTDDKTRMQFYKHLPFQTRNADNFLLFEQTTRPVYSTNCKKRVSIAPHHDEKRYQRCSDHFINDAASDSLSTLRELSPLHEEDLIDFQQSPNSLENLPSLDSSLEYLHQQLRDDVADTRDTAAFAATEEQLRRLRSTLTFRDSTDQFVIDSRLTMSYDELDAIGKNGQDEKREEKPTTCDSSQELVLSVGSLEMKNNY